MFDQRILDEVPDYKIFLSVDEYDSKLKEMAQTYGFDFEEIGRSTDDHAIYWIKAGSGERKVFVWGFPHPNEPVGQWTIDWLIDYIGKNGDCGYTWYFIPNADPDGSKLNEGWFSNIELKNYFLNYYRPAPCKQMEWVFPVKYHNFVWDKPMPETTIMMEAINKIMPDVMYPLHNAQIGGAYFFATEKFDDEYFDSMLSGLEKIKMPLDMGEPEEVFMREIKRPFYYDFNVRDYYDFEIKLGKDPLKRVHGDNSSGYLKSIKPDSVVIKGEIPYFYDEVISNVSLSDKSRRELWLSMIDESEKHAETYKRLLPEILKNLHEPDLHHYVVDQLLKTATKGNAEFKNYVVTSTEYDKLATLSEEYNCVVVMQFYRAVSFGQARRAALKIGREDIAKEFEARIEECADFIKKHSEIKVFPIKKLVQTQLLQLFETLNYLERKSRN